MSPQTNVQANINGYQGAFNPAQMMQMSPISQASGQNVGPFGNWRGIVRGSGTIQQGPHGISTHVPFAPGYQPVSVSNSCPGTSPFATTSEFLQNLGFNAPIEAYNPLVGTMFDIPQGLVGAIQGPFSPYNGTTLPQLMPDGAFGFGGPTVQGPGAGLSNNVVTDPLSGGAMAGAAPSAFGLGNPLAGAPQGLVSSAPAVPAQAFGGAGLIPDLSQILGGLVPDLNQLLGGIPGMGGGIPGLSGGLPGLTAGLGGGSAAAGAGQGQANPQGGPPAGTPQFADLFTGGLFAPVPDNVLPGLAQSYTHQGGGFGDSYKQIGDGLSKNILTGQADPNMNRQLYNAGSSLYSPIGIFETGVGWAGGTANAGLLGCQANGMAWAMRRNPVNPGMIIDYANPQYAAHNFNTGFTNV